MGRKKYFVNLFLLIVVFSCSLSYGQETGKKQRIGFSVCAGSQQIFPYNSPDYTHNFKGIKGVLNRQLKNKNHLTIELQIEPGLYIARHQLLNEFFLQPKDGADYLEQRIRFTTERTITEVALNAGVVFRYNVNEKIGLFFLGSVGPMLSDNSTERLKGGFAFSDILEAGISYNTGKMMFEIKPGVRHTSNANLRQPNGGHNSSTIDFGLSFYL
jgi:hypothetical protein